MLAGEYNDLFADWTDSLIYNPLFEWNRFARLAAARAQSLFDNSPIIHAMVNCKLLGTHGAEGMRFRSKFVDPTEDGPPVSDSPDEEQAASAIEGLLDRALPWSDAGAQLSWQELDWLLDLQATVLGDGFLVRCWQDDRDAPLATCWRLIHPARVSNPENQPNKLGLIDGIEMDDQGRPVRLWVADDTKTPYSIYSTYGMWSSSMHWDSYDWYAPDGTPNVIHRKGLQRPIGIRGMTCLMPLVLPARMLEMTEQAYVVHKRVQTQHPFFFKVADIKKALEQYKGSKMANLLLDKDTQVERNDMEFKGDDFGSYQEMVVRVLSASWLMPWELVLGDHSAKSGASSRSLWAQYRLTVKRWRREHAWQVSRPRDIAIMREFKARGEPGTEKLGKDWQQNMAGRYEGPAIPMPDPLKEAQAAQAWKDLKVSDSTIQRELGFEYRDEIMQIKNDRAKSLEILGLEDPSHSTQGGDQQMASDARFVERVAAADKAVKESGVADLSWPIVLAAGGAQSAPGAFLSALSKQADAAQPQSPAGSQPTASPNAPGQAAQDGQAVGGKASPGGAAPSYEQNELDAKLPIAVVRAPVRVLACSSKDGGKVYIHPCVPATVTLPKSGKTVDAIAALVMHERAEYHAAKAEDLAYPDAHQCGLVAEHTYLSVVAGLDPAAIEEYEAWLKPFEDQAAADTSPEPDDLFQGSAKGGKVDPDHRCGGKALCDQDDHDEDTDE